MHHILRRSTGAARLLRSSHDVSIAGLQLVHAFRDHGHRIAKLDPLGITQPERHQPDLDLVSYGLTPEQQREPASVNVADASASGFARDTGDLTLEELHARLSQIYSSSLGVETVHCKPEHMRWLEDRLETIEPIVPAHWRKRQNLQQLTQAHMFEATLAAKYVNVKRFGIEGAESVIVGLNALLDVASKHGVSEVVMGMPHRGRLNVLANVARKPTEAILCEFRGGAAGTLADEQRLREQSDAVFAKLTGDAGPSAELDLHEALQTLGIDASHDEAHAIIEEHGVDANTSASLDADDFFSLATRLLGRSHSGDVKYHLGFTQTRTLPGGRTLEVSMLPNPSHLEAVNPLVCGLARAKQRMRGEGSDARTAVLPLLLHGDAAFCAQGVVFECLGLSDLFDYTTGGAVHVVLNNQIGFTTTPAQSRSSTYCTDVAKTVGAPIFHVNADDVEAVVRACTLAIQFRQEFQKDVVIDVVCYRRHGHQESDNPMFTQPEMYTAIKHHPPALELYTRQLVSEGILSADESQAMRDAEAEGLSHKQELAKTYVPSAGEWLIHGEDLGTPSSFRWRDGRWQSSDGQPLTTGIDEETLRELVRSITTLPEELTPHRVVATLYKQRAKMVSQDAIDWALAEQLAWASCLVSGMHVRLSGQDVERGTFSHRHAVLHDQVRFGRRHMPLQHLSPTQAPFEICNSSLSEFAVLGFELGCSLARQPGLVMWEAQFGDFANTAQTIIDQFVCAAESKWSLPSALVMLLPHGYEGAGPEHSSARLERFLQLCDDDEREIVGWDAQVRSANWQVVNVTTPANFFHVLRRQVVRPFRKPLVVMAPKQLLRHKLVKSPLCDFLPGSRFERVLVDPPEDGGPPEEATRLLLCSGRLWVDLLAARAALGERGREVALLRLEQIAPFPYDRIEQELARHPKAQLVWVQEEPLNAGAWQYVRPRMELVTTREAEVSGATGRGPRQVRYVGRRPSAAPATGLTELHKLELDQLLRDAMR